MNYKTNLKIIGSGAFARDICSYLINDPKVDSIDFLKIPKKITDLQIQSMLFDKNFKYCLCLLDSKIRSNFIKKIEKERIKMYTFIHPTSIILDNSQIGKGSIIGPFNIVGNNTVIGKYSFLNKFCNIGHDNKIDSNFVGYPYSMTSGNCDIGKNVTFYTKSYCFPHITIGNNASLYPGAILTKSLKDNINFFSKRDPKQIRI